MENKSHETLGYAYVDTCMRTYAPNLRMQTSWMHMHAGVLETMNGKFFTLKLRFEMNLTSFRSHSKPLFSQYKKPYMVPFQEIESGGKHTTVTRNSELKREFFTKHPQVNFLLIKTLSSLDLWFLKFTNKFCLVVNRFDLGNDQNQAKELSFFRYKI